MNVWIYLFDNKLTTFLDVIGYSPNLTLVPESLHQVPPQATFDPESMVSPVDLTQTMISRPLQLVQHIKYYTTP